MNRLTACLTLRLLPGIGPITAQKLVHAYGSPEAIFLPGTLPKEAPNPRLLALLSQAASVQKQVEKIKSTLNDQAITPLLWGTAAYPLVLSRCPDAPLILFVKGQMNWEGRRWIAIVGTRKPTHYGRDNCVALVKALAPFQPVIVSGMAYGIDVLAHKTALDCGLDTVACLPHALERPLYPAAHQLLAVQVEKQGALVSDFLVQQGFERGHFVQRNRLIAGLSQATVVIETGRSGGSLLTAQFAYQYDRELFALPGPVQSEKSQGCHALIQQHKAILLDTIDVLVETLQWKQSSQPKQQSLPLDLLPKEQQLYALLLRLGRTHLDALAKQLAWSIAETAVVLMQLEMKKMVRPLPAKYFEAL